MAVQKSKVSRAKRGTRRAHDSLNKATLSTEPKTGEKHHRHHVSANGYYRGRQIVEVKAHEEDEE